MRNLGLVFGIMAVVINMVEIGMSVFIDISKVWFVLPIMLIAMWIICEIISNGLEEKRNKKRIRSSN